MIKKILLLTAIVLLCLFIPISCATCRGIVKAEEKNTVNLTADGTVNGYSPVYYLLGGLPVQSENALTMNISTQSLILYNELISNNASGDIYETKLIVPVRTSNNTVSIVDVSLGQSGYDNLVLPLNIVTVDIAFHNAKASVRDDVFSLNCTARFFQLDSDITSDYSNFNDFMQSVVMVKRFNYLNQGKYYCTFQFYTELDLPPKAQLYFAFPLSYEVQNIQSFESYIYPQATLDISNYIDAELDSIYNVGYQDGFNSREPFFTIVNGINDFMGIKLFGNFTFGTLFGIIISLSMLMLGLHLFRG